TDPDFTGFERSRWPQVGFVCLTEYDPDIPAPIAYPKEFPAMVLADVLAEAGLRQYHIAETEKYAHVTFFLNGGIETAKPGEQRVLVPSPKVATYDLMPEMSCPQVAATLAAAIEADQADVYIVNFANCDMVGHTGSIPAAIQAVQAVDAGVGLVLEALEHKGGIALLTADHGNADKMLDEQGGPHTAHTTAPVPCVLIDYSGQGLTLAQGSTEGEDGEGTQGEGGEGTQGALCNLAPTLLEAIGITPPSQMTAKSLLVKRPSEQA
ncbi:MAG: 2,3-bisphosphoglycerate-independent phosphoglycerate mutase, partial [Coriobacteriaceae bacterium]|nr:2,3-bisphosphoglycerate-independent phosphoglycerate mutase [Coriobacteriaceae bacterium]